MSRNKLVLLICIPLFCLYLYREELFGQLIAPHLPKPFFQEWPCKIESAQVETLCGRLYVDEHRGEQPSGTVSLPVVRFLPKDPLKHQQNPFPPVLYIEGGPGGNSLTVNGPSEIKIDEIWSSMYRKSYGPWLGNRELIVFDQRGAGGATPSLRCPELQDDLLEELLEEQLIFGETDGDEQNALRDCYQRLSAEGINTQDYSATDIIKDIEELRQVLEIKRWTLLGSSYGSKIALWLMDINPDAIEYAILDGTFPPDALPMEFNSKVQSVISDLADECQAANYCGHKHQDSLQLFNETVARLNSTPKQLSLDWATAFKDDHLQLDGELYRRLLAYMMGDVTPTRILQTIDQVHQGELRLLKKYGVYHYLMTKHGLSIGAFMSVACGDPSITTDTLDEICQDWRHKPLPVSWNRTVKSAIPTLLLAGRLDASTPVAYAQQAKKTLKNGHLFIFPNTGHGVISSFGNCALGVVKDFLNNPQVRPDAKCRTIDPSKIYE